MFEEVIEALEEEASRLDVYATDARAEAEKASRKAVNYQRRADEKRLAIQVLRSAQVMSGAELINRGDAPDSE